MRIVLTGSNGQLGQAILRRAQGHDVVALGRERLDITAPASAARIRELAPDAVINTAAYTDVDGCERNPDEAFRVNALGARNVAVGAATAGAILIHISTDYVFSGTLDRPYWEFDTPDPVSVYGESKLAGERLVTSVHPRSFVVRSAWLYGLGGRNFVSRVLELADERPSLDMVDTEVGSPTFCADLADALLALLATEAYGLHHLVNEGECSRYEFARAILDRAGRPDYPVRPTAAYERAARPPQYAPLRNFAAAQLGIRMPHWTSGLDRFFERRAERVA